MRLLPRLEHKNLLIMSYNQPRTSLRNYLMFYIVNHCLFIGPVFLRVGYLPLRKKFILLVTAWCCPLINDLHWQKISYQRPKKIAVINLLSLAPMTSTRFDPSRSMVQVLEGSGVVPRCCCNSMQTCIFSYLTSKLPSYMSEYKMI